MKVCFLIIIKMNYYVTQLENVVSKETQLNMLPQTIVDNAQEELDRMTAERIREEGIPLAPTEV